MNTLIIHRLGTRQSVAEKLDELLGYAKHIMFGYDYLRDALRATAVPELNDREVCLVLDSVFWSRAHGLRIHGDESEAHNIPRILP